MKKLLKSKILNLAAIAAIFFANTSVSTNCYFFLYQPKIPDKLKKRITK